MEKLEDERGGCAERGGGEGGGCRLRQVGVVLGFAVLLAAVVAQATWNQYQLREMEERLKALEGKPSVPSPPDEETTTFIIQGSTKRSERAAKDPSRLECSRSPSECMQYGEKPSAHLVPSCSVGPRALLANFSGNDIGASIIENFWAESSSCPPTNRLLNNHMTGGMSLYCGSVLMVPCPGLYYVYAQMGLKQETHGNNTVGVTLTKVCPHSTPPHALILEKYSLPSPYGGYPFLAGTFNMTCGCGFALSTPILPQLRVIADNQRSYFGAFLVDGVSHQEEKS